MPVDDPLGPLDEAVADGRPVEWDAERGSVGHADLDRVGGLQVLAEIARLHREAHTGPIDEDTRPADPPTPPPELFKWGALSVREKIGVGSFGEVYRAWDPSLQREV